MLQHIQLFEYYHRQSKKWVQRWGMQGRETLGCFSTQTCFKGKANLQLIYAQRERQRFQYQSTKFQHVERWHSSTKRMLGCSTCEALSQMPRNTQAYTTCMPFFPLKSELRDNCWMFCVLWCRSNQELKTQETTVSGMWEWAKSSWNN